MAMFLSMMRSHYCILALYVLLINYTNSEYMTYQQKPAASKTANCDTPNGNTALVEHFFNLIFSEFFSQPPVCICVQMCLEQPTYCYPNGCLKIAVEQTPKVQENRLFQVVPHTHSVIKDQGPPMTFLVDPQKDFLENFLDTKSVNERIDKYEPMRPSSSEQHAVFTDIRPDLFKERYKTIFKYRKSPKVHLRYNLREQVKNMKSDVIRIEKLDVAKTRWPIFDRKQFFLESPLAEKLGGVPSLGMSVDHPQFPNRFFKRETVVSQPGGTNQDNSSDTSFSLENLIENLIETSFGPLQNDTELDLNVNVNYYNTTHLPALTSITLPSKGNPEIDILIPVLKLNETTDVYSINNTNENIDNNKYTGDDDLQSKKIHNYTANTAIKDVKNHTENQNNSTEDSKPTLRHTKHSSSREVSKNQFNEHESNKHTLNLKDNDETLRNVYNEMISKLSKNIETQNNLSMELMEQLLGHRFDDSSTITDTTYDDITTEVALITDLNDTSIEVEDTTNTHDLSSIDDLEAETQKLRNNIQKKSRQRFATKLQSSNKD